MKIEIIGTPAGEEQAFVACMQRIYRWGDSEIDVKVYTRPRTSAGWLEWIIDIHSENGKQVIVIGMIQREPGKEWEFHS
jgi:hypothetical protein